jgi:hypothetical protein
MSPFFSGISTGIIIITGIPIIFAMAFAIGWRKCQQSAADFKLVSLRNFYCIRLNSLMILQCRLWHLLLCCSRVHHLNMYILEAGPYLFPGRFLLRLPKQPYSLCPNGYCHWLLHPLCGPLFLSRLVKILLRNYYVMFGLVTKTCIVVHPHITADLSQLARGFWYYSGREEAGKRIFQVVWCGVLGCRCRYVQVFPMVPLSKFL